MLVGGGQPTYGKFHMFNGFYFWKLPLGTQIAHVWEENESLVTSIGATTVSVKGIYKKSVKLEYPVWQEYKNENHRVWQPQDFSNFLVLVL